ncbi:hypothetical protein Tco_0846880 [Tanacetum coccineum]
MTKRRNSRIFTPFANLKRQFRARKENTLILVYNIFSFYESESSESKSKEMGEVGIETLTTKHYLDLTRGNQRAGVVIPEIYGNVNSKIKGQFLQELRDNTFFRNKNEDAYKYVEKSAKHPIAPSGSYPKADNHPLLDKRPSLEETIGKYYDVTSKRQEAYEEWMKSLRESTNKSFKKHDSEIKNIETNGQAIGPSSPYFYDQRIKVSQSSQDVGEDDESPQPTPIIGTQKEPGTFAENVKRRIVDEQENIILEILQNELPPKEKDPMSLILPCIIGSMTISNALADLGASMNVMPFSMFKWLVDIVILDIVDDDKVPIILGRLMLATSHARNDLRDFLEFNDILPENDMEHFGVLLDLESKMAIGLDDFSGDLESLLD